MKRNKHKTKDLKEGQKYFRIEYKSKIDGENYWHKATGRNKIEAMNEFKEDIAITHVENVSEPLEL